MEESVNGDAADVEMEPKLFRTVQIRKEIEEEPGVNGVILEIDFA